MSTFADVRAVARDARCRLARVTIFFEVLFGVFVVGAFVVDLMPPRPHIECTVHHAQTMSHYPHPYGEPPEAQWTRCEWRR